MFRPIDSYICIERGGWIHETTDYRALGSGGARGMAHIGVLSSLEKQGIQVDMIAGSSIGALVGSFYAAGQDVEKMKNLHLSSEESIMLTIHCKIGLLKGNRILQLIHTFTYGKNIEEMRVPLAIVACDLQTGEKVVFKEGSVSQAVRASISIPGVFVPHEIGGRQLVDGAVVDRIPVSVLKEMGADLIIASDVSRVKKQKRQRDYRMSLCKVWTSFKMNWFVTKPFMQIS